jgi:hypothetical protein
VSDYGFVGLQGLEDLNNKVHFTQKINLLSQNTATPIDCLFQVRTLSPDLNKGRKLHCA